MERDVKMKAHKGFSLLELMAVVIIILIMLAAMAVTFGNSRPSIKVKRDASQMVSFLRNMWDLTKATGAPLVLQPDYEQGTLAYTSPREGFSREAEFESDSRLIAFKLNDRLFSQASMDHAIEDESYNEAFFDTGIYLSEGRGLAEISVIFGVAEDQDTPFDEYEYITMCTLNLITGKGRIDNLDVQALEDLFVEAEEAEMAREMEE